MKMKTRLFWGNAFDTYPNLFSSTIPAIVEDPVTMSTQGEIVELGNPGAWRCAPRIQI
jgi:hypothetical protein